MRRAFTYIAGENWASSGSVRPTASSASSTTGDHLPVPANRQPERRRLADLPVERQPDVRVVGQAGNEYGNSKAVYLSPQIAGFDFGLQYAPNTAKMPFGEGGNTENGLASSNIGSGTGTGLTCSVASTGCPQLSSGPGSQDGSRAVNQVAVGVRYQGAFGPVGVLAYGVYMGSGHATYTGFASNTAAGVANLGNATTGGTAARFTGNYNGLSLGSAGVAVTAAGFTVGGNVIFGRDNGQLACCPGRRTHGRVPGRCEVRGRTVYSRHRGRRVHRAG